ncbi:hypothetical protein [Paenibacillus jiagnxiensis]|uniref:hypothetical protein n=1 Tax=Paenibacillus jiagnxiensis TaxID=3228926 RepID=UPI0034934F82
MTGTTGPTVTFNNLTAVVDQGPSGPFVAPNQSVPLDRDTYSSGTAILHPAGSPTIFLAPNQQYYVSYNTNIVTETGAGGTATGIYSAALALDGNGILGTQTNVNLRGVTADSVNVGGSSVIQTGAGGGELTLINTGTASNTFANTGVTVVKLA